MKTRLFICLALFMNVACKKQKLFTFLTSDETQINFENTVNETDSLNIMTYEYLYNGGGVALGDINNDNLVDVYFTGNEVPNKLYLNKGNLKFEDITTKAGVSGRQKWKTGTTMADVNGDGLLDIYVCYSGPGTDNERKNQLFINEGLVNGTPHFSEQAQKYGLDAPGTFSTQMTFFDMDHDGDLDAFLVNHADMFYNAFVNTTKLRNTRHPKFGNILFENINGTFTDISEKAHILGSGLNFGLSASISDMNNDGWPDIFVTNDYNEQDQLYLNNHDNTFKEELKKSMGHISQFSMGSDIADFNNDLLPDLITMDMLPEDYYRQKLLKSADGFDHYQLLADSGFHYQNMRNMLQLNMGLNHENIPEFSEIGQLAGISNTDWSWSPLFADFNNDGWKDLYITNGYLKDFTNLDFLKYTYAEAAEKAQNENKKLNTWELVKQLKSTKLNNYWYCNNQNLEFENKTSIWADENPSISTGSAYADLDNDGDLDMVVNNINQNAFILKNNATEQNKNHYVQFKLKAINGNTDALGAKVSIYYGGKSQMQELYTTRGFQSASAPILNFGLGDVNKIDSALINWPNGEIVKYKGQKADTLIALNQASFSPYTLPKPVENTVFTSLNLSTGTPWSHQENFCYIDFKNQLLLPYQVSKRGPFLCSGDVNGDGLEDVFIGGNNLRNGQLFLQQKNGTFKVSPNQPYKNDNGGNDSAVLLVDIDQDKDLDLIVAKGSSSLPIFDESYQPDLFLNNGSGIFTRYYEAFPNLKSNCGSLAAADYDHDGDIDLFFGGFSVPANYPMAATSFLLINDSKNGKIQFNYDSKQPEQSLRHPGVVCSAVWADINNDSWQDLILCGEYMPVTIYQNYHGILKEATANYNLQNSTGMWQKVVANDLDNDGDIDLVAGNFGLNSQFTASEKQPLAVYYDDFDKNGTLDPIFTYYIHGVNYPFSSLDELAEQIPSVRKKFNSYQKFAKASFSELFTADEMANVKKLEAQTLTSTYFENRKGQFIAHILPIEAQFSPVSGIIIKDFNSDNHKDLLICGNLYPFRAQLGKMDASHGWLFYGNGKGDFKTVYPNNSGLTLNGDFRDLTLLKPSLIFIAAQNNGPLVFFKTKK